MCAHSEAGRCSVERWAGSVLDRWWHCHIVALHWRGVMRQGRWVRQGMQVAVS